MKTEDLKAQGLSDKQITFVMAENGKDIKREKDRADGRNICGLVRNDTGKSYTLTDTKAAEGYKLNKDSKTFEFKFTGNSVSYTKLNIDLGNDSQKGKISVYKSGEAFTGVTALGSAISVDENGEITESGQTTLYTCVYGKCSQRSGISDNSRRGYCYS